MTHGNVRRVLKRSQRPRRTAGTVLQTEARPSPLDVMPLGDASPTWTHVLSSDHRIRPDGTSTSTPRGAVLLCTDI
jgi:hypothetical protein